MSEINARSFNQLFIIGETGENRDKGGSCNKKAVIALITVVAVLCVVLFIVLFPQTDPQTDPEQTATPHNKQEHTGETGVGPDSSPGVDGNLPPGSSTGTGTVSPWLDDGEDDEPSTLPDAESTPVTTPGGSTPGYVSTTVTTMSAGTTPQSTTQEIIFTGNCTSTNRTSGCISSAITECHPHAGCETYLPNRYLYADTPEKLRKRFDGFFGMLSGFTCHPRSAKFLCALLHPPCYAKGVIAVDEPNYAFDVANIPARRTPVPCRSLGRMIGESCFDRAAELSGWNYFFANMPQSRSSKVCFGGGGTPAPASCRPNPCMNRGFCLTQRSKRYCKCRTGYYGEICNETLAPDGTINRGQCVLIPEGCRSVLPYDTTRGINLNGTSLAYIPPWNVIKPVAEGMAILCALSYPACETGTEARYQVCFGQCNQFKLDTGIEFLLASMDYPSLQCEELPRNSEVPPGTQCINTGTGV